MVISQLFGVISQLLWVISLRQSAVYGSHLFRVVVFVVVFAVVVVVVG